MKIGMIVGLTIGVAATSYAMANGKKLQKMMKKSEKAIRCKFMEMMDM